MSVNDEDIDSANLTYALVTDIDPSEGTLVLGPDGQFTYTPPNADFNGEVTFEYQVSDGEFRDNAIVTIRINPVNDAPVATDDEFTIDEAVSLTGDVSVNDGDIDSANLTYTLVTNIDAAEGTLVLGTDGRFTYTPPNSDFIGTVTFEYQVSDGDLTDTAEVTITIDPVNDAPVAEDDEFVIDEAES